MAQQPLISIRTLYLYDNTIFENFVLPEGIQYLKDDIIAGIMTECDELGLVWAEPQVMKKMIGNWSRRRLLNWTRYLEAFDYQYDLGDNYNMKEIYSGEDTSHGQSNQTYTSDRSGSTNNTRNGYNSGAQAQSSGQSTKDNSKGGQDTETDGHLQQYYEKTRKGNTGVATYQDMIQKEMEIALTYDLESLIIDEFRDYFCVVVY